MRQATHDGWDDEEFLLQLIEAEVLSPPRQRVARLLRQACCRELKTLEQLDWEALRGRAAAARPARNLRVPGAPRTS